MLDVKTLFAALFAAYLIFGMTLAVARRALADQPALALWARGAWVMLLAHAVLALRLVAPEWISIVVGNALMFVSVHLQSSALHRFVAGRPAPRWQLAVVIAGTVLITLMQFQPTSQRTALVSAVLALQGASMLRLLVARGWRAEPSLRMVALAVAIGIASLAARTAHALADPAAYDSFWQPSLGNGLTYLAGYLFPLGAGIGFVIANLERATAQLREQATHDGLTGCLRRGVFNTLLEQTCGHAQREREPLALVVIDLDHFKAVNDTHGHQAGDQVLQQVAQLMRKRLRKADAVGRMGGEEFALMLPSTDAAGARHIAETLREAVAAQPFAIGADAPIGVTISAGVALLDPAPPCTSPELYRRADAALYAAKRGGRNRIEFHAPAVAQTLPT